MSDAISFEPLLSRHPEHPLDPPDQLARYREEGSLKRVAIWDGTPAWVVTRYEDARTVLRDERFSASPKHPGFPEKSAAYKATVGTDTNLRTLDNPEHGRQKRMVMAEFTVSRIKSMRPAIEVKVHSLIDAMLAKGNRAEFIKEFALSVPTMIISEMLGVPYADRDHFAACASTLFSSKAGPDAAIAAAEDLRRYLLGLIEEKIKSPTDDLTSRLAVEQVQTGNLSFDDFVSTCRFLLVAGHDTTQHMISLSTLALFLHPDQLDLLKRNLDNPDFVANAIEEFLRYLSITHTGRRRVAIADVMVNGQLIKAGEGVIVMNSVADRDERHFADAGRLDLQRANARTHLAFGFGIHQCIGQMLARDELQIVHTILWNRIPSLRLGCDPKDVEFIKDAGVYGIEALPVEWDA